jgi:hypothetical protein
MMLVGVHTVALSGRASILVDPPPNFILRGSEAVSRRTGPFLRGTPNALVVVSIENGSVLRHRRLMGHPLSTAELGCVNILVIARRV